MKCFKRIAFLCLLLLLPTAIEAQGPVFRIGVLGSDVTALSMGANLAIQQINAAGGVRGADGNFFQLELISQPTSSMDTAIANLNQSDVIAVLGPVTTTDAVTNMGLLQGLGLPILTPATGDSLLITDTSDLLFRSRAARILQGQALASYVVSERGLSSVVIAQLDVESTDAAVGFSTAVQALGVTPQLVLLQTEVTTMAASIIQNNPQVAAIYGPPDLAAQLVTALRQAAWNGVIAYDQAANPTFQSNVESSLLPGILAASTWPYTATDTTSTAFLTAYVQTYGSVPDEIAASGYDSVLLLAQAISLPGELLSNLRRLDNVQGVQGLLRPSQLSPGETSNTVAVTELSRYGVPQVAARYAGGVRLPDNRPPAASTATPLPTATPAGVVATVTGRPFQNVRSGPSTVFEILGQMNEGEQAQVIGASRDNTWVVIDFRGRQGWMSAPLLDIFGNLNTVPIIDSPPTPTPAATATAAPPQEADIVVESAIASPSPIIVNQPFNVNVVVRNNGNTAAGQFAIAATFPPNGVFTSATIPGLGPGQAISATLSGTLSNTGFYSVVIVADLNDDVPEGPGEGNNTSYTFSYAIDKPIIRQSTAALDPSGTLDLEGNAVQGDVNWSSDASRLDALFNAKLGIIPNVNMSTVHWDLINPGVVNQTSIPRSSMAPGTIIGVITADGNRGVIQVDNIAGNQFQCTFRVYQN